ncbi:MAG: hypothetical protein OEZ39_17135 [Gammaproteobacteria bacterium]|nr:hypothetical protein [Gammaproteobacteria bacterium]MDH5653587.1 hypothetical protein [Gammaproteobacteria bacterium]
MKYIFFKRLLLADCSYLVNLKNPIITAIKVTEGLFFNHFDDGKTLFNTPLDYCATLYCGQNFRQLAFGLTGVIFDEKLIQTHEDFS